MGEPNYYLYIVGVSHPRGLFNRGDCGVGVTHLGPGIMDCPYGTMYVIPKEYIDHSRPGAHAIEMAARRYYMRGGS